MIKATSTETDIHIAIKGMASEVMLELGETISGIYGLLKKDIGANMARAEILQLAGCAIYREENDKEAAEAENEE